VDYRRDRGLGVHYELEESMDNEKQLTPSELRNIAQQLIKSGQMPSPEKFSEAMGAARKDYVPKLKKISDGQATK